MSDDAGGNGDIPVVDVQSEPPAAPSRIDRWIDVFNSGTAVSDEPDLFVAAFEALSALLRADPRAHETLGRVLDRPVDQASPRWLASATEAMDSFLGVDAAYLVQWLAYDQTPRRLDDVAAMAPAPVTFFLRSVLAEHGAKIDLAQRIVVSGTHDWTSIKKHAYVDALTGRRLFVINVIKLDGSTVVLECPSSSLLGLTTHLLELVNTQSVSDFSPGRLGPFLDAIATTFGTLQGGGGGADGDSDPSVGAG